MPIIVCPKCGARINLPPETTNRRFRCRNCMERLIYDGQTVRAIPQEAQSSSSGPSAPSQGPPSSPARDQANRRPAEPGRPDPAPPIPPVSGEGHSAPGQRQRASIPQPPSSRSPKPDSGYPWDIPDEQRAKAEAYDATGAYSGYRVQCIEYLHILGKQECAGAGMKGELRIYPDLVGLDGRRLPLWLAILLAIASFPMLLLAAPIATLMAIPIFLMGIVFLPIAYLFDRLMGGIARMQAEEVRKDPNSPKAIKIMFRRQPLLPRYLVQGDVKQVVRVNMRRLICGSRYLILFVYNRPIEKRPGCVDGLMRFFSPQRRILTLWVDGLREEDADKAAAEAARVLGLTAETAVCHNNGVSMK